MILCPEFRGKLLLYHLANSQLFAAGIADEERIPGAKHWELRMYKRVHDYHTVPLVLSHGYFSDNSNRLLAPFWSGWVRDELIQDFMWPNSENTQLFHFSIHCSASIFIHVYLSLRLWNLETYISETCCSPHVLLPP